jgi:DNA repair protein RadA/Sms
VPANAIVLGEIALSGEIRPVSQMATRLKEAAKLGFERALVSKATQGEQKGIRITGYSRLGSMVEDLLTSSD